jgi:hypothetical protein
LWREGKVIGIEVNIIIRRRRHPPRQNDYDDTPFSFDRDMKLARLTLTRVYFNADQSFLIVELEPFPIITDVPLHRPRCIANPSWSAAILPKMNPKRQKLK